MSRRYAEIKHVHDGADLEVSWEDILDRPDCFTACAHTHDWSEITGKPDTFPPDSHTHTWDEITDVPNFALDDHTHAEYLTEVNWDDIIGLPECFTPCDHTHPHTDITFSGLTPGDVWTATSENSAEFLPPNTNITQLNNLDCCGIIVRDCTVTTVPGGIEYSNEGFGLLHTRNLRQ